MTNASETDAARPEAGKGPPDYLRADRGIKSWLLTTDHKRIAIMFMVVTLLALMFGGLFAMLIRIELLTPGRTIVDAISYDRFFTLHGVTMIFLFLIPSIPAVFGNFFIPIMLGAKDLAFPRINLLSFYVYLLGAIIVVGGMIVGGTDTGWTFYAPYSTTTLTAVVPVVGGIFIIGVSSILTGLNFIVTTHTLRNKDISWKKMPLFVWAIYGTSIIQVLATPVIGMAVLLVGVDHIWKFGIFDPSMGGDPVLFQHLFWFYSHPAVYIMILPTMGVISEVVCSFSHNPPSDYNAIAYSSLGIAFAGFLTWGHHMFVAGLSNFDAGVFGALSMFVGIFSAIKVFTWVATLYRGSIRFTTPMLYFFWFLFLFVFGGMSGIALATQALDVPWQDTYFVVAHFHFIMAGGALMGYLAAVHYWFPKMFGRMYNERMGLFASGLVFMGFVLTFLPQFLLGNMGMPRRYYSYPPRFQTLNVLSSAGAGLIAVGLTLTLVYLLAALFKGPKAPDNPWQSKSYEWKTPTPPPKYNFVEEPSFVRGPYDYRRRGA